MSFQTPNAGFCTVSRLSSFTLRTADLVRIRTTGQRLSPMPSAVDSMCDDYRRGARGSGGERGGRSCANAHDFGVPLSLMSKYDIEYHEQLAHAGDEWHFRFLARSKQSRVKGSQDWVSTSCDQGAHVAHGTNLGTATPNRTCVTQLADRG